MWWLLFCIYLLTTLLFFTCFQTFCLGKIKKTCYLIRMLHLEWNKCYDSSFRPTMSDQAILLSLTHSQQTIANWRIQTLMVSLVILTMVLGCFLLKKESLCLFVRSHWFLLYGVIIVTDIGSSVAETQAML